MLQDGAMPLPRQIVQCYLLQQVVGDADGA